METEVLKGAARTIDMYRPLMYVENDRIRAFGRAVDADRSISGTTCTGIWPNCSTRQFRGPSARTFFPISASINVLCIPNESKMVINGMRRVTPLAKNGTRHAALSIAMKMRTTVPANRLHVLYAKAGCIIRGRQSTSTSPAGSGVELVLPPAGIPVLYVACERCGFCYAPELHGWTRDEFAARIYNDDYILVDPDYRERRPRVHADDLIALFGDRAAGISHLDYGGGQGLMSDMLRDSGWQSTSYDPFVDGEVKLSDLGKFDLVTAYEVFEHVPDVRGLARNLSSLIKTNGIVHFSTCSPTASSCATNRLRGGTHPRGMVISACFRGTRSIYLAANEGLNFTSFSPNLHAFWRTVPSWASHILR